MQYSGSQDLKTIRRYFTGTTTIRKGQIFHYDQAATKTDADPKLRLGQAVQAVAAGNVEFFAGGGPGSGGGKGGPRFVEPLQPPSRGGLGGGGDGTAPRAGGRLPGAD